MAALNKATLIGHLGKDPKVSTLNSGGRVVSFSVATTEKWKDKTTGEARERTQWHQIVIFNEPLGKIADFVRFNADAAWLKSHPDGGRRFSWGGGVDVNVPVGTVMQWLGVGV